MNFVVGRKNLRGAALAGELRQLGEDFDIIESDNRRAYHGRSCESLIFTAGNQSDWKAQEDPSFDFRATVDYLSYFLHEIHCETFVLISSVAVYSDLSSEESTREDTQLQGTPVSVLGFHKRMAEDMVRYFAKDHLILRVPLLVGRDVEGVTGIETLSADGRSELAPESQVNLLSSGSMARFTIEMMKAGLRGTFNLAATDTLRADALPELLGKPLRLGSPASGEPAPTRISIEKASAFCQFESSRAAFEGLRLKSAG